MKIMITTDHTDFGDLAALVHYVADQIDEEFTSGHPDGSSYWELQTEPIVEEPGRYHPGRITYRETHHSRRDGSPAMLWSREPFELINEDGYIFPADPDEWEEIPGANG